MTPKRSYRKLCLHLSQEDRKRVHSMLRKGYKSARVLKRVAILDLLDKGESAKAVSRLLDISPTTVRTIAWRYLQDGLDNTIFEHARSFADQAAIPHPTPQDQATLRQ